MHSPLLNSFSRVNSILISTGRADYTPRPPDFHTLYRSCSVESLSMQLMNKQLSLIIGEQTWSCWQCFESIYCKKSCSRKLCRKIGLISITIFLLHFLQYIWKNCNFFQYLLSIYKQNHRGKSSAWWRFPFQRLSNSLYKLICHCRPTCNPKALWFCKKKSLELHAKDS